MPIFSAGSASVSIVPDFAGAQKAIGEFFARQSDISVKVKPDLASGDVARTEAELNAMHGTAKVEVDRNTLSNSIQSAIVGAMSTSGLDRLGAILTGAIAPAVVTAIGGAFVELAAVTSQAVGVLALVPAGLAAIAIPAAAVKIGISGVGAAFKAIDTGNAQKIAETMAKLAPSAQAFVTQVHALAPAWTALKLDVQQQLFANLGTEVTKLAATGLPVLRTGLASVASDLNAGLIQVIQALIAHMGEVATVFGNVHAAMSIMAAAAAPITSAFTTMAAIGSQFLPQLATWFVAAANAANDWVQKAARTGELTTIIQNAINVIRQLGELLINVGKIIADVFQAAVGPGTILLGLLVKATGQLATFAHSTDGQAALGSFFTSIQVAVGTLLPALNVLVQSIVTAVLPAIGQLAALLAPIASQLLVQLASVLVQVGAILPPVAQVMASLVSAMSPLIPIIGQIVVTLLPPLVNIFAQLAPIISQVSQIIGQVLLAAAQAIAPVLVQVGAALIGVLNAVLPLLPQIASLAVSLLPPLATAFLAIVSAVTPLVPYLVQIVQQLLPPLVSIVQALIPAITGFANSMGPVLKVLLAVVDATVLPFLVSILNSFAAVLNVLSPILGPLATVIVAIVAAVKLWTLAQDLLDLALDANPIALIIIAIGLLVVAVGEIITHIQVFKDAWNTVWTAVSGAFSTAWSFIQNTATTAWNAIAAFFTDRWAAFTASWNAFWTAVGAFIQSKWTEFVTWVEAEWTALAVFFTDRWAAFTASWNAFWTAVGAFIQSKWTEFVTWVEAEWTAFTGWLSSAWAAFTASWNAFWTAVGAFIQSKWTEFVTWVEAEWTAFASWLSGAWATFTANWNAFWTAVGAFIQSKWTEFVTWVEAEWTAFASWLSSAWASFTTAWNNFWTAIGAFIQSKWTEFVTWVEAEWTAFASWLSSAWAAFTASWNAFWTGIGAFVQSKWTEFVGWVQGIWTSFASWASGQWATFTATWSSFWTGVGQKFNDVWNGIKAFAVTVWNDIKGIIATPINFVIGTILNGGLFKAWNAVNDFLHLPFHINDLPTIPGFATGGYTGESGLFGTTGPEDPAGVVHAKEFVFTANQVDAAGGPGAMYAMANQLDSGYARGGLVRQQTDDPQAGYNSYVVPPSIAPRISRFLDALSVGQAEAVQAAGGFDAIGPSFFWGGYADAMSAAKAFAQAQSGKPYVWGGVGPGGFDCSGYQSAITNVLQGSTAPNSRIGTTETMPWGGFVSGLSSAYAIGNHRDPNGHMASTLGGINAEAGGAHNNVAFGGPAAGADGSYFNEHWSLPQVGGGFASGGGGGGTAAAPPTMSILGTIVSDVAGTLGALTSSITGPVNALMSQFGNSPWVQILAAMPKKLLDGMWGIIKDKVASFFATAVAAITGGGNGAAGTALPAGQASNEATVQAAAAGYGWNTGQEWNDLVALLTQESGFNNTAQNPTSTAYGMFQFLDATWAGYGPKTGDPALQAKYGLAYIKSRYGDPVNAWNHEQLYNWFDNGGWLPPGASTVFNGTGGFEAVLNKAQQQALTDSILGDGKDSGAPVWHFYLGDREITDLVDARVAYQNARDGQTLRSSM